MEEFTLGETAIDFDTNNLPASQRRVFIDANLRFPETLSADSPLVRQLGTRRLNFCPSNLYLAEFKFFLAG